MRTKLIVLLILILQIGVFGQQGTFEGVDDSKINSWLPKLEIEYQAVYHFGNSEWESNLILICGFDKWYAQIVSGQWSDDGKAWIRQYETLNNVRVKGNKFYSDKTNGEFVCYDTEQKRIKGLKVYKSWSGDDGYEIGYLSHSVSQEYSGKYPQASLRQLDIDELQRMSKNDLMIMRNEIYARYGFIFKSGGMMDIYFKKQNWYNGQHDDVTNFLTGLEKENIKLIQQIENK